MSTQTPILHSAQLSYERQRAHAEQRAELPACYSAPDSVDAWQNDQLSRPALALVRAYPGANWMTIGDGQYGADAYFLKRHGVDVLATSLTDHLLAVAHERGFIDRYRAENAECLSAADDSCDFVLCKLAYHHFPRPAIALYEMLRVARRGVVLIEPQETRPRPLDRVKSFLKRVLRGDQTMEFEESGNFVFRINVRELQKMMIALDYEVMAVRRFNFFYHAKLASATYSTWSLSTLLTRLGIAVQDVLSALRLMDYGLACVVAFKEPPSQEVQRTLRDEGFRIMSLPKNPYLHVK